MSVFGPKQVEEVIIGLSLSAESSVADFINNGSNGDVAILGSEGGSAAANKKFKLYQFTDGEASKGLNYEFSDTVNPKKVTRAVAVGFSDEVQKSVSVTGFDGNITADTTYSVEVRIYNDGGTLSPENFAIVSGYYVTGSSISGVTSAVVRDGLLKSLNDNLVKRGDSELVLSTPDTVETDIVITGKFQKVVPGKITGRQIEFEVTPKAFSNVSLVKENLGVLSAEVLANNTKGYGTGKYAVNLEWFTKGYKYESYRGTGYPADFGERTPYYANPNGQYDSIHINYFDDRSGPSVETQERVLTILVPTGGDGSTVVNTLEGIGVVFDSNTISVSIPD